ncbi:acyl-CoA dehydrogenase family protein [Acinetobacter baylyi]|uniref:acyl-CoA dehydrogenase family protein n=1 Tax=Acinetobacter baylyi TaxID=202950 RepID=UPI000EA2331B|nr:acyl-CoA dehydrogenase family protein [Acinetobacter baylyi]
MMTRIPDQSDNQFNELCNYNLYQIDVPLQEILKRYGHHEQKQLTTFGEILGHQRSYMLADQANRHLPQLHGFDARGRRIDEVEFHPAWHQWMRQNREYALHAHPFITSAAQTGWVEWAARFYLSGQVESGSLCPSAMTLGSIPLIQRESKLWQTLGKKLLSCDYDERDILISQKSSIWVGMGMTEKQGGSDVRANQTFAKPVGISGRGEEYLLTGHKWFFSAPMSDAHLVVAKTSQEELACFFVPRWLSNGSKNHIEIQQLKNKVGNKSNSSSEVEFRDALGIMIGEEGRGIPTIIEMATYTRLTCSVGSTAILRQALVQCIAYTRQRRAFGRVLADQPLMQAVLTDMALETEAALHLSMHLAACYQRDDDISQAWVRLLTPAAKFWICKRAVELTGEAMEVFGGNGYVETGIMSRLFKEAPVNSIWEGSGNIMCLDVLRAIQRHPESIQVLFDSFGDVTAQESYLYQDLQTLKDELQYSSEQLQFSARHFVSRLVLLTQAVLMRRYAPHWVSDAFIQSRYGIWHGRVTGILPVMPDSKLILERAYPE